MAELCAAGRPLASLRIVLLVAANYDHLELVAEALGARVVGATSPADVVVADTVNTPQYLASLNPIVLGSVASFKAHSGRFLTLICRLRC